MNIFDKKSEYYLPPGAIIFFSILVIVMVCYVFSVAKPYLFNEHLIFNWFYMIFPLALIFCIYFIYFHKWKVSGQTGFQMKFSKEELANPYFKAKQVLASLFWVCVFSAASAWATWGIPACGAYFYSKQPVTQEFVVDKLRGAGNSGVDVGLVDKDDGVEYSLKQPGYLSLGVPWNIGDTVCAKGRTSFFGTIVEDFRLGAC
jgi:hypothetical protein